MEEKDNIANVPYIVYESSQTRMERINKRLIVAVITAIVLLFATNAIWIYAWCQYDYSSEESTNDVDAEDGTANYIGRDGSILNGQDKSNNQETIP